MPEQTYVLIVAGDPDNDNIVIAIGYATSSKRTVKGIKVMEAPSNIKLSDTQPFSGKNQQNQNTLIDWLENTQKRIDKKTYELLTKKIDEHENKFK